MKRTSEKTEILLIPVFTSFLIVLLRVWPVSAEVEVVVSTEYYPVYGETESEIRESLERNALAGEQGENATALTESSLRWKIDMFMDGTTCSITSVMVWVEITYFLPRLEGRERLDPELAGKWEAFMRAVEDHEQGHKRITEDSAREMERMMRGMEPTDSCDTLKAAANEIGNRMNNEAREMNKIYDINTAHGAEQGVVF